MAILTDIEVDGRDRNFIK